MVDDLLDVTSIDAGQLNLKRTAVDLDALIRHNVALNNVLGARKQITIEYVHSGEVGPVEVDTGKIEQVLNNLVSNAIKFSHAGKSVQVSLRREEDRAVIAVTDQGQGIPAGEIENLFAPFSPGSVRGTAGERSTGLGLAIVRRIVEGHGGTIRIRSVVGEGSTFTLTLPLTAEHAHPSDLERP